MFVLSKVYLFLANPGVWVLALLALGTTLLWTRWRRAGRRVLTATILFILAVTILPLSQLMIAPLEMRFPLSRSLQGKVDGVVVLGGTVNQYISAYWGQPSLTGGAERLTEAVGLALRFPAARVVFSGGSGSLVNQEIKESSVARAFFAQMGVAPDRLTFESESRNTVENAQLTYRTIRPRPGERWLLVTSAMHMPRAMGCFRRAGWAVEAYPVDFVTTGYDNLGPGFDMVASLDSFGAALREYMALAVYRILGRTDALFPRP